MNLNFIFLFFVTHCKNLLSTYVSKILISLIISKSILLITEPKEDTNSNFTPYNKKVIINKNSKDKCLLSREYSKLLKERKFTDCYEKCCENATKIHCTLRHLKNSTHLEKNALPLKIHLKLSNLQNTEALPAKIQLFLCTLNIFDIFKGNICFPKNISSVKEIKNKLTLNSSSLIIDKDDKKCGVLFLCGFLESDITYSLPEYEKIPLVSKRENCIIKTPFNNSIFISFDCEVNKDNNYFNDFNICLKEYKFSTDVKLLEKYYLDDYTSLYNNLRLSVIADYTLELYNFNNKN